ncbi:coenzyme A diphosphatase [Malassezia pachydermatis]|uniref:Peroxisomal nudix hydrolase n=1 Tax=Malassezia pachydermatis TaxID=77020 RepID=A0A0M9VP53_9BASI|nr:peroxisomal nudix hydrolase [Malassezia pachydermatis]KOS14039.1 peroxisomal nudix hydrolase [Malassezia pachydermatis]
MSHTLLAHLQHGLIRLATISPRVLASPPTQPRRASVALILRIRPAAEDEAWLRAKWRQGEASEEDAHLFPSMSQQDANGTMTTEARLRQFFALPWVQRGTPEVLFIKRAVREGDNWSSHVAFPGGRRDPEDESGVYTAMRETWEEVGIDLADKEFLHVGHLEDREITSSLGKRLLMILSPYVFMQLSPFSPLPNLQPTEVSSLHWVPLSLLFTPTPKWGTLHIDIARHAPRSTFVRLLLQMLVGKMSFRCIELANAPSALPLQDAAQILPDVKGPVPPVRVEDDDTLQLSPSQQEYVASHTPPLQLWGLTLGMTLDFLSHMATYNMHVLPKEPPAMSSLKRFLSHTPSAWLLGSPQTSVLAQKAPSTSEVFPRFTYPDVNFWIWMFGWRYRAIHRRWQESIGTELEHHAHWSGLAMAAFYSCVRRALVLTMVLRAMGLVTLASLGTWFTLRRFRRAHL